MNCLRCNGLAVCDDSLTVEFGSSSDFHAWRCLNCGMVIDDVIAHNRHDLSEKPQAAGMVVRLRERHHAISRLLKNYLGHGPLHESRVAATIIGCPAGWSKRSSSKAAASEGAKRRRRPPAPPIACRNRRVPGRTLSP
jgi:hypothetical protein